MVLDVVVTDKKGNLVLNLDRNAFSILEDKEPQAIRSFDSPAERGAALPAPNVDSTAELDKTAPNATVTILVLDEINTRFEDEIFARDSLKRFLEKQGKTLSQPTILLAANVDRFMMLHDYTTSRDEILNALEHHLAAFPWQQQATNWKTEQFNAAIASLMEIAEATSGHPGHKGLIWIGRGFPTFDPDSMEADSAATLRATIETCTNALRDARISLYTLDPAGISASPTPTDENGYYEEDPFGGQVDFNNMARATGGKNFFGRNDVDNLIGVSARDAAAFYTLSYRPHHEAAESKPFHNIRVVMKDPNLRATTRAGYYDQPEPIAPAKDADGKPSNREVFDLTIAGASTMIYDGIPITVEHRDGDTFEISIPAKALPWEVTADGQVTTHLSVLARSTDPKGKLLSQSAKAREIHLTKSPDAEAPAVATLEVPVTVSTAAPAARLRFVVRVDSNGKMGAANVFLVDEKTLTDPAIGLRSEKKGH